MVEFVCRHVKKNQLCFGGMQIIGCGDFKQLPPVPNKYLNDDGEYCFLSPLFDVVFPHHVQLLKVVRQTEPDLAMAVQQLCDGSPSLEAIQMLRSLSDPLHVPDAQICRLYGSNFDARFVNEQMLDNFPGNVHVFRADDEGNRKILHGVAVPKTLLLKEGAPVILVKSLGGRLFNGQRGYVHKLEVDSPPVINFSGELHQLKPELFEIFNASLNRTVASRTQIPVILGFAMTVHRAQGQTLDYLEVDCSSFFAPGHMGVAVGRAVSKTGLRILNFNMEAAMMKHPDSVYDFYKKPFQEFTDDTTCCNKSKIELVANQLSECNSEIPRLFFESDSDNDMNSKELPRTPCQFDINEFIQLNKSTEFIALMDHNFIASGQFKCHLEYLNFKIDECISDELNTNKKWVNSFKTLNQFLVGKEHVNAIKDLFQRKSISKNQNKLSSKLSLWLLEKKINMKTESVLSLTEQSPASSCNIITDAGSSKLRYLAGACIHSVRNRLRQSVERNIGKIKKSCKLTCKLNYQKEKMLKRLEVTEDSIDINDPSMLEITFKQNKSKGLTIVNEEVFVFFRNLNVLLQSQLTSENMHLNLEKIRICCRKAVDNDNNLFTQWINLFTSKSEQEDSLENEIFLQLLAELFTSVTEHFLRLAIVDGLKQFKRSIPRKKKQALRMKIQALGERGQTSKAVGESLGKRKRSDILEDVFICPTCETVCEENPSDSKQSSIGCDTCNNWYHYICVGLTGNEQFLQNSKSTWLCPNCNKKGKGKGKKSKN